MCGDMHMCVGVIGDKMRVSDPLEPELQVAKSHPTPVLGTKGILCKSSKLTWHGAISPSPTQNAFISHFLAFSFPTYFSLYFIFLFTVIRHGNTEQMKSPAFL